MASRQLVLYRLILVVHLILSTSRANAYGIEDLDLSTKVERSELIIVGTVRDTYRVSRELWVEEYAVFEVEEVLKGDARTDTTARVMYKGAVSEDYAVCCERRERYLLFLEQLKGKAYKSVNGRYGVYHLKNERLLIGERAAGFDLNEVRKEIANGAY